MKRNDKSKGKAGHTPKPTGKELLAAAVNQIVDHPEKWKQSSWHCGSSHCIAGWCQVLAGLPPTDNAGRESMDLTGLSQSDADYLFAPNRTLPQIHSFVEDYLEGRDGFGRNGYDRDGFGRNGYDRDGFGRNGYDRNGYDRNGKNKKGDKLPRLSAKGCAI